MPHNALAKPLTLNLSAVWHDDPYVRIDTTTGKVVQVLCLGSKTGDSKYKAEPKKMTHTM